MGSAEVIKSTTEQNWKRASIRNDGAKGKTTGEEEAVYKQLLLPEKNKQLFHLPGVTVIPQQTLVMSRDIAGCHNLGQCYWHLESRGQGCCRTS